jgi:hypothetical protein
MIYSTSVPGAVSDHRDANRFFPQQDLHVTSSFEPAPNNPLDIIMSSKYFNTPVEIAIDR